MKKVITMAAVVAVAGMAVADLAYFKAAGGKLFDEAGALPAGTTWADGAVIQLVNLNPFVVDNAGNLEIDIANIPTTSYLTVDMKTGLAFQGGNYNAEFQERPATALGATAFLVFDPNGGGIQEGDVIGLSAGGFVIEDMAAAGEPAPTSPQAMAFGDITANVTVIPEPATIGLMGIAGLGMYLARRKARR